MALLTNINGKFSVSDAGAVTFNNAFTFPTTDGTANYVLKTNGSGTVSWSPDSSPTVYWAANGNDIYNTNSANVGIGTDSPSSKLQVAAGNAQEQAWFGETGYIDSAIRVGGDNGGGGRLYIQYIGDSSYIDCYGGHGSTERYRDLSLYARNLKFFTTSAASPSEVMRITSGGNVGIGTTSVFTSNHILNLSGTGIAIKNDTNGSSNNWSNIRNTDISSSSNLVFTTGSGDSLTLNHDKSATFAGDIKIDNTTPYLLNNDDEILTGSDVGGYYFGLVTSTNASKALFIGDHNNYMRFDTDGSEKMRITSGGNVGIGRIPRTIGTYKVLDISGSGTVGGYIGFNTGTTSQAEIYSNSGSFEFVAIGEKTMRFYTNGFERIRIESSGNVVFGGNIIGNSGGSTEVGAFPTGGISRIRMVQGGEIHFGDTTTINALGLTEGAWNQYGDTDRLGLYCRNELKIYGNSNLLRVTIPTSGNATFAMGATFADMVTINGGNLYVTKSTPQLILEGRNFGNSGAAIQFLGWANTSVNWQLGNAIAGSGFQIRSSAVGGATFTTVATIAGGTGVYTATSDVNRKKDFENSEIGLKEVMELQPKLFRMKTESTDTDKHLGFIAQEVKEVIPQAYVEQGEDNDKIIGLSQMPIIAALTKAIQELKAEIELLKSK